jgi:PAS domain S-box-containing protein
MRPLGYPPQKHIQQLWYAIAITLMLVAYRLTAATLAPLRAFFQQVTPLPVAEYLMNFFFFWLLGLLWIAYRDWTRAIQREGEVRRILSSIAPDSLLLVSPECRIIMCSATVESMFGYRPDELLGLPTSALYGDRRDSRKNHDVRQALETVGFHIGEGVGTRKDGRPIAIELVTSGLKGGYGAVILIRDISTRKAMEDDLNGYRQRLEELVRHRTDDLNRLNEQLKEELEVRRHMEREILEISSREKRRIGQDFHDTLGQEMAGIGFLARALEIKLKAAGVAGADDAGEIGELLSQAMAQARRIARGLAPVELMEEGLTGALRRLAEDTATMFDVACEFAGDPAVLIHDHEVATHLFHVAQEAISNAVRHGKPSRIQIRIEENKDGGILTVEDNGKGLPTDRRAGEGLGLHIMKYRAEAIGGAFDLARNEPGGMRAVCTFVNRPTKKAEHRE